MSKIDSKGRVSLPSSFRNSLKEGGKNLELFLISAFSSNCLRGGPEEWAKGMTGEANREALSPDQARRNMAFMGNMNRIKVDSTGRFVFPNHLQEHVSIKDEALFIGGGEYFEIWNVNQGKKALEDSLEMEKARGDLA